MQIFLTYEIKNIETKKPARLFERVQHHDIMAEDLGVY